jgi:hypothetical protein
MPIQIFDLKKAGELADAEIPVADRNILLRVNAKKGAKEYLKVLDELDKEIDELINLSQAHMRVLSSVQTELKAALTFTLNQGDMLRDIKDSPKAPVGKKAVKKPSDLKKLERHYKVTVEMAKRLKHLDVIEAEIEMDYGPRGTMSLGLDSAAKKVQQQLQVMRQRIYAALQEAYTFMTSLAQGRVPEQFEKMAMALSRIVSKALKYDKVTSYLYVYPEEDTIAFTQFFALKDLEDDSGRFFPQYLVVLTGILTDTGLQHYLNTLTTFSPPGTFDPGKEVKDAKDLRKIFGYLLDLDKVSNSIARVPLHNLLSDTPVKDQFSTKDLIHKLTVEEDELVFTFKRGVTQEEVSGASQQINLELQALAKRTSSKVSMQVTRAGNIWTATYSFVRKSEVPVAVSDLEFLKDRFDLKDATVKRIVDNINRA